MEFKEVIKHLKQGKKVRRPSWNLNSFLVLNNDEIVNNQGMKVDFCNINSMLADDWEIHKDEESLSDKLVFVSGDFGGCDVAKEKDIIEAVRKLKYFVEMPRSRKDFEEQMDKIFGSRLIC